MKTKQIRIRLTQKLIDLLQGAADELEITLTQFIRFIVIKELQKNKIPRDNASKVISDEINLLSSSLDKDEN